MVGVSVEPANNVKRLRLSNGWTITDLARNAGVSSKVVSKVEATPPQRTMTTSKIKISNALGAEPREVFPYDKEIEQTFE